MDYSGGSSGDRCDPGEVLSLLHVPSWEVVITISALPRSQGPCGVRKTMMTMKMKLKATKTASMPTCVGH